MTVNYAPNPILTEPLTNFTGGLNLRADAFQLSEGESPDLLNVDLDPRGGFTLRDGVDVLNSTALSVKPKAIFSFATASGTKQIVVQQDSDLAYSTGGNFTSINPDALTTSGTMTAVEFNEKLYVCRNAENAAVSWDGTTSAVLGTTLDGTAGNMPKGKCIAAHGGYVWVANTIEGGTSYPNRVRFSNANQPTQFPANYYIDIDTGHDGDYITALVPFHDRLLVFKANSVYAIFGYDAFSFNVQPVSQAVGTISQASVTVTDYGVYFFSWPEGVMRYDGSGVEWVFERMWPKIQDGTINSGSQSTITLGWINRRLWVSVPYGTSQTTNNRVFVLDPSLARRTRYGSRLGREGGWTMYDIPCGPFLEWQPPNSAATFLACHANSTCVLKLHQTTYTDKLTSGGSAALIDSYYTTRWMDAKNPALIKRWKRPEIVLRGTSSQVTLTVDVWRDYDTANIVRTLNLQTNAPGASALVWGTGLWGTGSWAGDSSESEEIHRLGTLGRGRAVRLRVNGPSTAGVKWAVDSITFKFIPRRMRA